MCALHTMFSNNPPAWGLSLSHGTCMSGTSYLFRTLMECTGLALMVSCLGFASLPSYLLPRALWPKRFNVHHSINLTSHSLPYLGAVVYACHSLRHCYCLYFQGHIGQECMFPPRLPRLGYACHPVTSAVDASILPVNIRMFTIFKL